MVDDTQVHAHSLIPSANANNTNVKEKLFSILGV